MTRDELKTRFPRASNAFIDANAGFTFQPEIVPPKALAEVRLSKLRRGREPNNTEAEYGAILEAQKRRGEIIHYVFEGINLRWGDGMRYTCDYAVFVDDMPIKCIEIKGAYRWQRDVVRFKGCAAEWKTYFDFEMWEKSDHGWRQLY